MRRQYDVGTIKQALERKGLKVVAEKKLNRWPEVNVERFYGEHRGRFFYPRLVHYMGSGPIIAVVLKGQGAIAAWRELIGPTHLSKARETTGCLRGEFAVSDTKNSFHGSDSPGSAKDEVSQLFPDLSLDDVMRPVDTNEHRSL